MGEVCYSLCSADDENEALALSPDYRMGRWDRCPGLQHTSPISLVVAHPRGAHQGAKIWPVLGSHASPLVLLSIHEMLKL